MHKRRPKKKRTTALKPFGPEPDPTPEQIKQRAAAILATRTDADGVLQVRPYGDASDGSPGIKTTSVSGGCRRHGRRVGKM